VTVAPRGSIASPTTSLTDAEYATIVERLGRHPNAIEVGILAAMWSEHCGYKHSRPLLKRLPTTGARVVQGPGENAGAVDIGDGLLCVLKMESHNHPSAVEPFQGAATGVGGILRDIFTMGARPIAMLDSLRFGPLDEGRSRYLFHGVVAGVGHYGNCMGVPTVGGEVYFDPSFTENPLVNAMCVGIVERDNLTRAGAGAPGDIVLVVGSATGRDGIHGATFASAELGAEREEQRPNVQVGNPFLEKLLLEACLSLLPLGMITAMQDLGAAGLTSSAVEVAARGGRGIRLDTARVSRRESGLTPYDVMLSESQERVLLVVPPDAVPRVVEYFARWDLHSDAVGEITDDGEIAVLDDGDEVARLPIPLLTDDVPTYVRDARPRPAPAMPALPPEPADLGAALLALLASPNICSRRSIFRTYDHTVRADTMIEPGLGAAVVRIRGTTRALAMTTDCNPRYTWADPRRGAAIAVAEAARNLACRGAEPVAVTDCLNFGNPERPEAYWELSEAIDGLGEACRALGVPIVSGNVSLYNETDGVGIKPSPIVGMVGLIEDRTTVVGGQFREVGDAVLLLGPVGAELSCSEYLGGRGPTPSLDLDLERRAQLVVREATARRLLRSAHDCSDGGLAVALAESAIAGNLGFLGDPAIPERLLHEAEAAGQSRRLDAVLFGEGQSRFVLSCNPDNLTALTALADEHAVPIRRLGTVAADGFSWSGLFSLATSEVSLAWNRDL